MYWFIMFAVFAIIAAISIWGGVQLERRETAKAVLSKRKQTDEESGLVILGVIIGFCAAAVLITGVLVSLYAVSSTYRLVEQVRASNKKIQILDSRSRQYKTEFSALLVEAYPQHEKEIFKNLSSTNLLVYAVKFPRLSAVEGFKELVKQLSATNDELYKERLAREDLVQQAKYNKVNPWCISWMIPEIPAKVSNYNLAH